VRLCRNLQILGAFGYLGKTKGKPWFLGYVPGAVEQLRLLLRDHLHGKFPQLQKCVETAARRVGIDRRLPGTQVLRDFAAAN
jgi:N-acetylmuramate 1-kinase